MKILLVYATYSSGTETAAIQVKKWLEEAQQTVVLKKAIETVPDELTQYDLVVLASPSWWVNETDGQPHIQMLELLEKSKNTDLNQKKFAVFGLGDITYAHFCGAVRVLEKFIQEKGGTLITSSLRIDSFYFDKINNTNKLSKWIEQLKPLLS